MKTNLVDRNAIMQVIGCLIRNPLLFSEVGNNLNIDDFDNNLTKSIFNAIYNLYQLGADKVNIVDIDNYLQQYGGVYSNFQKEKTSLTLDKRKKRWYNSIILKSNDEEK